MRRKKCLVLKHTGQHGVNEYTGECTKAITSARRGRR